MNTHRWRVHKAGKDSHSVEVQGVSTGSLATTSTREIPVNAAQGSRKERREFRRSDRGCRAAQKITSLRRGLVHHLAPALSGTGGTVHRHNGTSPTGSPSQARADAESRDEISLSSHPGRHGGQLHHGVSANNLPQDMGNLDTEMETGWFQPTDELENENEIQTKLQESFLSNSCPGSDSPEGTHHHSAGHSSRHHVQISPDATYIGTGHASEAPTWTNDGCIDPALLSIDSGQRQSHHHHGTGAHSTQRLIDTNVQDFIGAEALASSGHHHHQHDPQQPQSLDMREVHAPHRSQQTSRERDSQMTSLSNKTEHGGAKEEQSSGHHSHQGNHRQRLTHTHHEPIVYDSVEPVHPDPASRHSPYWTSPNTDPEVILRNCDLPNCDKQGMDEWRYILHMSTDH